MAHDTPNAPAPASVDVEKLREAVRYYRNRLNDPSVWVSDRERAKIMLDAAESTLPRTKMVEVWHVVIAYRQAYEDKTRGYAALDWKPSVEVFSTEALARESAQRWGAEKYPFGERACITVTGPHQHLVPS